MGDLDLTEQFYEFYKISREKSKGSTEKKPLFPSAKQKDYDEFLKGNLNFIGEAKNLVSCIPIYSVLFFLVCYR